MRCREWIQSLKPPPLRVFAAPVPIIAIVCAGAALRGGSSLWVRP
jgi:hypothetical protein